MLKVGAVTERTEAEGPGQRFAVWAQGCSIRCSGCFNPHLWTSAGGEEVSAAELADRALASDVEGVTLLGGEPFEQAEEFARLANLVKDGGLSVMTFTGHLREELDGATAPPGSAALLAATDLLIDGPYRADDLDFRRPWVGSTNQRFHFLTERYAHLEEQLSAVGDRVEVRVSANGEVSLGGWASVDLLDSLLDGIAPPVGRGSVR